MFQDIVGSQPIHDGVRDGIESDDDSKRAADVSVLDGWTGTDVTAVVEHV